MFLTSYFDGVFTTNDLGSFALLTICLVMTGPPVPIELPMGSSLRWLTPRSWLYPWTCLHFSSLFFLRKSMSLGIFGNSLDGNVGSAVRSYRPLSSCVGLHPQGAGVVLYIKSARSGSSALFKMSLATFTIFFLPLRCFWNSVGSSLCGKSGTSL